MHQKFEKKKKKKRIEFFTKYYIRIRIVQVVRDAIIRSDLGLLHYLYIPIIELAPTTLLLTL